MGVPGEFGSALIGSLVSVMLYGITTLQERFNQAVQLSALLIAHTDLCVLHAPL